MDNITNSNNVDVIYDMYQDTVYGPMLDKYRVIFIDGDITFDLIKRCVLQFYKFIDEDSDVPIHIMINSPGGIMDAAFWLISEIELCDCQVITYNVGSCMSAAAKIFIAGDLRIMYPYSSLVLHSIRSGRYSVINNFIKYSEFLDKYNEVVKKFLKDKTKLSNDMIKEILDHDNELNCLPEEAIKYGLADQIYLGRVFVPPRTTSAYSYNYAVVDNSDIMEQRIDNKDNIREMLLQKSKVLRGENESRHSKTKKRNSKKKK